MQDEKPLDNSSSSKITEPPALPDDKEIADDGSFAGTDRLSENESEMSFTDFTTKDADGCVDAEAIPTALSSPETIANDRKKYAADSSDLNKSAVRRTAEDSEVTGLLNDSGNGEDSAPVSEDSTAAIDGILENKSTELDSVIVHGADCNSNPSHVNTVIDVSNADGITEDSGPDDVDVSKVGTGHNFRAS